MNTMNRLASPQAFDQPDFVPAPWNLTGKGYAFVYNYPEEFIRKQGMIPPHLQPYFRGGIGTIMLVDYSSSNCGPYHELLFIPGRFQYHGRKLPSVSRIFVSTTTSVVNGRRNWGIPKELAEFQVNREEDGSEVWRVRFKGIEIFRARLGAGIVPIPLTTAVIPSTLMQSWEKHVYFTKLSALGWGRRAKIHEIHGDGRHFPNVASLKPLVGIRIENFRLTFHKPTLIPEAIP